jgi:hypothetical protein
MTEQATFKNPFLSAMSDSDINLRPFGTQALQAWTQAQSKLLENSEALIRGWLDRNRAAADATVSAVQKVSASTDPAEIARIWADLAASQAQRTTEGVGAFCEQYMTMWQQMGEAARKACNLDPAAMAPAPAEERPPVPVRRAAAS